MTSAQLPLGSVENPIPRRAARVLLVDGPGRILLFRGSDPGRPGSRYWFTVGGGLDDEESSTAGAVRELREETGLALAPEALGQPVWHETTEFPFEGRWYHQEQDFYLVRVDSWTVSSAGFDVVERRSIDGHRWWSVAELEATSERFYPRELPELLREMLGS
jgi:8-oxo-dGTP pyrophosphatase MutT (NUDIX family)